MRIRMLNPATTYRGCALALILWIVAFGDEMSQNIDQMMSM
jgi:hypothetical protein